MGKGTKRPNSKRNLDAAIERLCSGNEDFLRVRRQMANVIVGQLLPNGAVKGGSALKIRFGQKVTRFSMDLDTARATELKCYADEFEDALEKGWESFTGRLVPKRPAKPLGVPSCYVMQPFDIKLSYNGKSRMTVPVEVGHNEVGDAENPDMISSSEMAKLFDELGFPEPGPVPVMRLEHQVAQKIHAVSEPGSQRAHDLVDLQVIIENGKLDYVIAREICLRLFDYRRLQSWPPTVSVGDKWAELYAAASADVSVLATVDEAVSWANALIERIDSAERS